MNELKTLFSNKTSLTITILLSLLYVLPLVLANVWYQDDYGRAMHGYNWIHDGRFFANWINSFLTFSVTTFSLFPFSLLISAALLGSSGYMLSELLHIEKDKKIKWSSLLLLISPFFLANLPYRYDVLFMSLSIALMIVPFVFFKNSIRFFLVSSVCFFLVLGLFQPSISIYFLIGIVFLNQRLDQEGFTKKMMYYGCILIASFVMGYILYQVLIQLNATEIAHDRMKMILFEPNFKELFFDKFNMFFSNCKLLYTTKRYYIFLLFFLIIPIVSVFFNAKKSKSFQTLFSTFLFRLISVVFAILLIAGPNLFVKADYLPMRALPSFGAFLWVMFYFSKDFSKKLKSISRVFLILHTVFCFNILSQTAQALQYQDEFQKMFVYDLNAAVRTHHITKVAYKGNLNYARKSYLILREFPFIKSIVLQEIGENAWFSKEVIAFSGLQETIEFVPFSVIKTTPVLVSTSYMYNLYQIEEGFFMIEFN